MTKPPPAAVEAARDITEWLTCDGAEGIQRITQAAIDKALAEQQARVDALVAALEKIAAQPCSCGRWTFHHVAKAALKPFEEPKEGAQ